MRLFEVITEVEWRLLADQPSRTSNTGKRNLAILHAMYFAGLGLSEVCDLSPWDLNGSARAIYGPEPPTAHEGLQGRFRGVMVHPRGMGEGPASYSLLLLDSSRQPTERAIREGLCSALRGSFQYHEADARTGGTS
jgi:hypothetical protein